VGRLPGRKSINGVERLDDGIAAKSESLGFEKREELGSAFRYILILRAMLACLAVFWLVVVFFVAWLSGRL
jgi:hypothetical protein